MAALAIVTQTNSTPSGHDEKVPSIYDAAGPVGPREIEFYADLASRAQNQVHPTLEVACGTGWVALPVAQA